MAKREPRKRKQKPASRRRGCITGLLLVAACGFIAFVSQLSDARRGALPATRAAVTLVATVAAPALATNTAEASATVTETSTRVPSTNTPAASPTPLNLVVATSAVQVMNRATYTTTGAANVRSCAGTDCGVVVQLPAGASVTVNGRIDGAEVNPGNAVWYRIDWGGQEAYIYSGVVQQGAAAPAPQAQVTQAQPTQALAQWSCAGDLYNCSDFSNRAALMSYWNMCPGDPSKLDHNNDNVPCESITR